MDLLDAIGQAGTAVDKFTGGRALRGTLAGKPRELLSVLPFSDTMGITNEHDATSGRDLTDQYGLTAKGDNSFGSNAAGFLADAVLSPGNLLGGYGAFKAAPTIGKGIAQGAKALAGLDLLDHIKGGAAAAGRLAAGESGALDLDAIAQAGKKWFLPEAVDAVDELPWERAIRMGKEAGIKTRLHTPESVEAITRAGYNNPIANQYAHAWYNPDLNRIGINGFKPEWFDNGLMNRAMYENGPPKFRFLSTSDPNGMINHEIGHAMHRSGVGIDQFNLNPDLQTLPQAHADYLRNNLSAYSGTNPKEAVAEIIAALKGDELFQPGQQQGLAKILNHYGGKNLWEMLGDQKLLRPLGYSLLGGLGLAHSAQEGS